MKIKILIILIVLIGLVTGVFSIKIFHDLKKPKIEKKIETPPAAEEKLEEKIPEKLEGKPEIESEVKPKETPLTSDIQPGSGKGVPPPMVKGDGPWNHRILIAVSSDGLNWKKEHKILADQASVPDAILDKEGRIRVYYVDYFNGGLSVAILEKNNWVYKKIRGLTPDWVDPDVVFWRMANIGSMPL